MEPEVALILKGLQTSPEVGGVFFRCDIASLSAYTTLVAYSQALHPWKCGWLWRRRNDCLEKIWTCLSSPQTLGCSFIAQAASHLGQYVLRGQVLCEASAVGPMETRGLVSSQLPPLILHGFRVGASSMFGQETEYAELFAESPEIILSWISAIESCRAPSSKPLHLHDRYEMDLSKPLGTGLFAVVVRARDKSSGQEFAIKVIRREAYQEYRPMIQREFSVWSCAGTSHPNICGLADAFTSETTAFFVAELCKGGGLIKWLARCPSYCENDACLIFTQILEALNHLHSMKLNHSDLKPENICMATKDDPHSSIRLIDFSMASFFGTPMDPGGTPEFVAPELLNDPEFFAQNGCGPSVDIWSSGIVLFFLLSGQTPFSATTVEAIVSKVQSGLVPDGPKGAFRGPGWSEITDGAKDLIRCLLRTRREERPSAEDALSHPWIQTGALKGLPRKPLEVAKKMFRAQALQAGEDVSAPFAPGLYSPSPQPQPSSLAPSQQQPGSFFRSQSARYSDARDSRQKGSASSILASVPESAQASNVDHGSAHYDVSQATRPSQRFSSSGSASLGSQSQVLKDFNAEKMGALLYARRSQSSRRDDYVEPFEPVAPYSRSSLPQEQLTGSLSTPTRSTPHRGDLLQHPILSQAGPSDVIQMLREELAGLQAEVVAKKRSTLAGLPIAPQVQSPFSGASSMSPTRPNTIPNDFDFFSAEPQASAPSRTSTNPQVNFLPEALMRSASVTYGMGTSSAQPSETVFFLQQQLRELQMKAAEKRYSMVGGSERGPRNEKRRTDVSSSSKSGRVSSEGLVSGHRL